MKKLRIAFISDAVYPYNKGGKESRLFELSRRLAAQGQDVTVYCMKWWKSSAAPAYDGVKYEAICPLLPLYAGERRSIIQGILFGISCFSMVGKNFDIADVDHMPFFPLYSMKIVCWLKRKPMVATWHEVWGEKYWNEYLGGWKATVAWWMEKWSVFCPDAIVAVSQMTTERLKKLLSCNGPIYCLKNGVNSTKIHSIKPDERTSDVFYAGRLLKHKNIDVLLYAFQLLHAKHPQWRLRIVGEGPEKERLLSLTRRLGLSAVLTFHPFHDDVSVTHSLMKSAKVYALPSTREGFGLAVLEANASGLPVVTVNAADNAAQYLIDPHKRNGVVVSLSAKEIARGIEEAMAYYPVDSGWVDKEYSWDTVSSRILEHYHDLNTAWKQ